MFNDIDFFKILDLKSILQANPGSYFRFQKEFLVFFGLLLLIGIVLKIALFFQKNKVLRKLYRKIIKLALTISVLGFIYLFCRKENIYLFSSRVVFIAILLAFIIWAFYINFYVFSKMQKELKDYQKKLLIEKYLPKTKKKRNR